MIRFIAWLHSFHFMIRFTDSFQTLGGGMKATNPSTASRGRRKREGP
jgi:hypothetical protein